MNINDVIALARAGYTKDEISALVQQAQTAPVQQAQPAPVQQAQTAPVQQAQPAPVQQAQPAPVQQAQPAPVQQEQPAPVQQAQPAPVQQAQPAYDFLTLLSQKIDGLSSAIKATNILNSQMPEVNQETAQDALASIIIPTYKKEANN